MASTFFEYKFTFLQSKKIDREMYVKPLCEFDSRNIWKLNRTIYGLKDASRAWHLTIKAELVKLGAQISHYYEALFVWHEMNVVIFLEWRFEMNVIQNLKQFKISQDEEVSFKYLESCLYQQEFEILISQNSYIDSVQNVNFSSKRKLEK